jgi:hypothetical protein
MRPESRGSKAPHVSLAAAALVALTVKSIDSQTPSNVHYVPETRPADERTYPHKADHHARPVKRHNPRHSQTHPTPAQIAEREVTPEEFAAWSKVNVCEEGGNWHVSGSEYSGGLGISNTNWTNYGGEFFSPTGAGATPKEQIVIAMRIQKNPPDQNGCNGGW